MEKLECVLVMPAYNEGECIEKVVTSWSHSLSTIVGPGRFKMVIVNDGSKDDTGKILDKMALSNSSLVVVQQLNAGHGAALLNAYRKGIELKPDSIFHVDSDDQFLPSDFQKFWQAREKSKFILGWRMVRHDAFHRLVITRILRTVIFLFFGAYIKDANVPYRLIERSYLERLLAQLPVGIFAPNIFLSVLACRGGQNLMSIPVVHEDRKTGVVSIVRWNLIKVCLRSLRELLNFRLTLNSRLKNLC